MKILVTPTSLVVNKELIRKLEQKAELTLNLTGHPMSEKELLALNWDYDGYIAGLDEITENVLKKAYPRLKVISRYGVGYEKVDIKQAGRLGITVTNTPGANTDSVADLAFSLILSCSRNIPSLSSAVKAGEWPRAQGIQIYGKTLGIIGLGAIGKAVAKRAKGFSMNVVSYDPYADLQYARDNDINMCSLDMLIGVSDIITLHIPHTNETHHMINREAIDKMKDGVIIINTSRGGLIDENDASLYIENGKIFSMGIDAFEEEPPKSCKLLKYPNVIATPHTGAHTKEAVYRMTEMSVNNLFDVLEGKENSNTVNKQYLGGALL